MRGRRGVVLFESMVALALIAIAAVALLDLAGASSRATRQAAEAEQRLERASQFITAVSLWPREDLDRRLGVHRQGDWLLDIQRVPQGIYDVALLDTASRAPVLTTTLFRAEGR